MASTCFCGCGQRVRFAKKKMSGWGAETVQIIEVLERVSLPLMRDHEDQQKQIQVFIDHGNKYGDFWKSAVHGYAPPTAEGLAMREEFFRWRENASGLARSNLALVCEIRKLETTAK